MDRASRAFQLLNSELHFTGDTDGKPLSGALNALAPTSSKGETALMPAWGGGGGMCVGLAAYEQKEKGGGEKKKNPKKLLSCRINSASVYLEDVSCYFHSWAEDRNDSLGV